MYLNAKSLQMTRDYNVFFSLFIRNSEIYAFHMICSLYRSFSVSSSLSYAQFKIKLLLILSALCVKKKKKRFFLSRKKLYNREQKFYKNCQISYKNLLFLFKIFLKIRSLAYFYSFIYLIILMLLQIYYYNKI